MFYTKITRIQKKSSKTNIHSLFAIHTYLLCKKLKIKLLGGFNGKVSNHSTRYLSDMSHLYCPQHCVDCNRLLSPGYVVSYRLRCSDCQAKRTCVGCHAQCQNSTSAVVCNGCMAHLQKLKSGSCGEVVPVQQ